MALSFITYHDENIQNIERKEKSQLRQKQLSRYVSKFKNNVAQENTKMHMMHLDDGVKLMTSSLRGERITMGFAETPLRPPCAFLRKNEGLKWRRENEHVCPKTDGPPPLPHFDKDAKAKEQKRANFIRANIEKAKKTKSLKPPMRYIDTPTGDRHLLLNTGLIPQYICSKRFGKVPCYLRVNKEMLKDVRQRCQQEEQQITDECVMLFKHDIKIMSDIDRQTILTGLKTNYTSLFNIYQKLPLLTDTIAKRNRKSKIEAQLRQLEQDIQLIENNPTIMMAEY